jgi:PadR family transcriptional regulator, regulatory protein PadR
LARDYLTDFELMILLSILRLGDEAYGVPIAREIETTGGRSVVLAAVYAALDRLEANGLVSSSIGEPAPARRPRQEVLRRHSDRTARRPADAAGADQPVERHSAAERTPRMTAPRWRCLAIALLEYLVPGEDALAGDLLEASRKRSAAWLWRQVLLAVPARLWLAMRGHPSATAARILVGAALLAILGFHALVTASLINHLLVLNDIAWVPVTGRFAQWQWYSIVPAFVLAVMIGRSMAGMHGHHRIAAIVMGSASTTAAAFLNLLLFVPDALLRPFVPQAALQTIISMFFIAGLFVGFDLRRACDTQPSVA